MNRRMHPVALLLALTRVGCVEAADLSESDEASSGDDLLAGSSSGDASLPSDDTDLLAPAPDPTAISNDRTRMAVATSGYGSTTCYLPSDGIPRCYGRNYGMLGNGNYDDVDAEVPEPVVGLDRVRSIWGNDHRFVALRVDGTIWEWGTYHPSPTQMETGAHRFRDVSPDGVTTCAVRTDGRVMCESTNAYGQMGNGTTTDSDGVFQLVSNVTDAVDVEVTGGSGCALTVDGEVWCWGLNHEGQLGNGTTTDSLVPVQVQGITGAVDLAGVVDVYCALLEGGDVKCWGGNTDLGLGTGNAAPAHSSTPVDVVGVSSAVSISAKIPSQSAGRSFCVVNATGSVKCWGKWYGAPVTHSTLTSVNQVVISEQRGLTALLADGTAVQTGQYDDATLTPVPEFETGMAMPRVAAGLYHTCALRSDGTVACWGENSHGELGNGTTIDTNTPTDVVGLSGVIDIASTSGHTCAVLRNGTAKCWGRNNEDQLGDGGAAFPESTTPVTVIGSAFFTSIATASKSTCAVHESGGVYCWGVNDYGQLGDGTFVDHATPQTVTGLSDAIAIASSGGHYCATRATGGVRCWGHGFDGELGNGTSGAGSDSNVPVTVKRNVFASLLDITAIAAGNATSCAVRADGTAHCWGGDVHGLGNGAAGMRQVYAQQVSGITTALDVSMGSSSECVLLATGTVKCFGTNQYGELGDWSAPLGTDQYSPRTVGAFLTPLSGVVAIDSGDDHSCAMLTNGTVKCWGWNSSGQLGDGTYTNRSTPVTVASFP